MGMRIPILRYLKAAFLWHWNLLAFGGGAAFALLSGQPDAILALLVAAELTYLGLLTGNVRFRKAVDARRAAGPAQADPDELMAQIRSVLKPEAWQRFETLRNRCLTLNDLARQLHGPQAAAESPVAEMQTTSLERLLWMFLKLLYSQDALQRFLRQTDRNELVQRIAGGEKELEAAKANARGEKLVRSLEDKLQTLRQRLDNYDRTRDNREFLVAELDRIEQKVNAVGEMAISSRDATDITAQVDGIAAGISATEEVIRKLDVAPVLEREQAPRLLTEKQ